MSKKVIKYIVELFYIFIIPLILICATTTINHEYVYDDNGNFQVSETTFDFDNSIIKYTDGYKNIINDFNLYNLDNGFKGHMNTNNTITTSNTEFLSSERNNALPYDNSKSYYIYYDSPYNYSYIFLVELDSNRDLITMNAISVNRALTFTDSINTKYFLIQINYNVPFEIANIKLCVNYSVAWANGNYISYGEPLILYTDTDVSGQNNINYTIWGNIKNSFEGALDLNDSPILNYVFCYVILWFIMFITWHLFYLLFDKLFHLRKE